MPRTVDRPSRRHQILAAAIPRLLGVSELVDEPTERAWVLQKQAERGRVLRTDAIPGFARRFCLHREQLVGPSGVEFPAYVITPRGLSPDRTLLWIHGGSFASPIDRWHVALVARLARSVRVRAVLPDYPLAPAHTWRDSYQPLLGAAARWAEQSPAGLLLGGDSAGGGVALALAIGLRDRGGIQPVRMVLSAPWADLTTSTPETADYALRDTWLRLAKVHVYAGWWAGSPHDLGRSEVSPALGDLAGLPPTLMFASTRDLLLPGCRLLADRGAAAGWELTYLERPDLVHNFPMMPFIPEAARAFRIMSTYLSAGIAPVPAESTVHQGVGVTRR